MLPQSENAEVRSISREADLAWLAGIIDGEGCIELTLKAAKNGKKYMMPKVRIYNTDIRMIEKVSLIYERHNLVFFYSLGNNGEKHSERTGRKWKTQIGICIASQGTTAKLLGLILPYLGNKRKMAEIVIAMVDFLKQFPKGGNTIRYEYSEAEEFKRIWGHYLKEKAFFVDPSTTTRRASSRLMI